MYFYLTKLARLKCLLAKIAQFHPLSIVTDFEIAMINAFPQVFTSAKRTGCFFHFSQCIHRQVQGNGLIPDYAASEFALFTRSLVALAFVLAADIITSFDALVDAGYSVRAEAVINYFEDNSIGRPDRRGIRKQPTFPINSWNVFDKVLESLPRTNDSYEGWHNGFQRSLMCSHPVIVETN
jgi:hypothetical protein